MAKVKKQSTSRKVDERANTEMVMLLIVTLGLAITTVMAFGVK